MNILKIECLLPKFTHIGLFICFFICINQFITAQSEIPIVEKGVIDLSSWDFEKNGLASLDGNWEFYWKQLITYEQFKTKKFVAEYIYVPQSWTAGNNNSKKYPKFGYATYRLRIKLAKNSPQYKIHITRIVSSAKMWINGTLCLTAGKPDSLKINSKPAYPIYRNLLHSQNYSIKNDTLELIFHVSDHFFGGKYSGILENVKIGKEEDIHKAVNNKLIYYAILIGILLIIGLYHLGLFMYHRSEYSTLVFALIAFAYLIRTLSFSTFTFDFFSYNISARLIYIALPIYPALMCVFFYLLFRKESSKIVTIIASIVGTLLFFGYFIIPIDYLAKSVIIIIPFILLSTLYLLFFVSLRALINKKQGAIWAFSGLLILLLTNIHDSLFASTVIHGFGVYVSNLGFVIYIFFQSINIAERFSISFTNNIKLNKILDYQNKNLEKIVDKRTKEVQLQKQEILEKNEELNQQNEEIQATADNLLKANDEITNKNEQITASVRYAKTIQTAVLPFEEKISKHLNNFILFRPKDIVSGDFYWFTVIKNPQDFKNLAGLVRFIAAIDCTGHGVPGAFMSMIGTQLLNKIVNEQKITEPNKILLQLHKEVVSALKQTVNENDDGMDVCLISIEELNNNKHRIKFSGAKRPLFYSDTTTNQIITIKGTIKSIGGKHYQTELQEFEQKELILDKATVLYLTTDGYIDQNNPKRKRFGIRRFTELISEIHEQTLAEQKQILESELDNWQAGEEQRDDITVIGVEI